MTSPGCGAFGMPGCARGDRWMRAPIAVGNDIPGWHDDPVVRRRTVLSAVVGVPVLAGCSIGDGPETPGLTLERVWTKPITVDPARGIDELADRVRILGDTLIVVEGQWTRGARVTAYEIADGTVRWQLGGQDQPDLPGVGKVLLDIAGRRRPAHFDSSAVVPTVRSVRGTLPLGYVVGDDRRTVGGVVGVDVAAGTPSWVAPAGDRPTTNRAAVTATSDDVVIMTSAPPFGPYWPQGGQRIVSVAVDGGDGSVLWRRDDVIGLGGDHDAVVVAHRQSGGSTWLPQVLDARTGSPRWQGERALQGPYEHHATIGGYTAFQYGDRVDQSDVVSLTDGTRVAYDQPHPPQLMAGESPVLVWDTGEDWWSRGPNGFFTQRLPDGRPRRGRRRPDRLRFMAAVGIGRYLWGELRTTRVADAQDARRAGVVALDLNGEPRSPNLPRTIFLDVTQRWLAVADGRGIHVHRIR